MSKEKSRRQQKDRVSNTEEDTVYANKGTLLEMNGEKFTKSSRIVLQLANQPTTATIFLTLLFLSKEIYVHNF